MTHERPHLPVLTGLRFIAALSVLLAHALHAVFNQESTSPFIHQMALQLAYLGLTLFFVLSGCVLTLNYTYDFKNEPLKTLRNFWVARVARLYPLYIFMSFVFLAFVPNVLALVESIFPWNFLLVQAWTLTVVEGAPRALYFFPYAWSISAEWFFYFLMPAIAWILLRFKNIKLETLIFFILYPATLLLLFDAHHSVMVNGDKTWFGIDVVRPGEFLQLLAYYTPFAHLSSFFAGCIVGKCILNKKLFVANRFGKLLPWLGLAAYIALVVFVTPPDSQKPLTAWDLPKHGVIYGPFIALFVFVLARYENSITSFLSNRFCQYFGETSYSNYLLHPLVAGLFAGNSPNESVSDPQEWLRVCIIIVFTLVISTGTYTLIEVPGRRWLRGKLAAESLCR